VPASERAGRRGSGAPAALDVQAASQKPQAALLCSRLPCPSRPAAPPGRAAPGAAIPAGWRRTAGVGTERAMVRVLLSHRATLAGRDAAPGCLRPVPGRPGLLEAPSLETGGPPGPGPRPLHFGRHETTLIVS
jgi:hypothetical protein